MSSPSKRIDPEPENPRNTPGGDQSGEGTTYDPGERARALRRLMALLSLIGLFVALYLLLYKMGVLGSLTCQVGSCEKVNTSKWATFLGLPVAGWGVAFYAAYLALAIASADGPLTDKKSTGVVLALVAKTGFVFSMWLTYLELYVIHAICQWCVVSAVIVTLILLASWAAHRAEARHRNVGVIHYTELEKD